MRKLRREDGRDVQVTIEGKRPRLWAINAAVAEAPCQYRPVELTRLYKEERAGRPTVQPMAADMDDDIADDPMFAAGDDGDDGLVTRP